MTLTKANIVDAIHNDLGFPKNRSAELIEILLEQIKSTLEKGEDVLISGFGKFCIKNKKERRGRNPATGDDMMLSQRQVVTFRCSHLLREKINGR
ncbi:MAG: integration host factor subunit alpha [Desulfobacteraceae bacterium]|jgi:integration host factor subunit alpha|nr:integration host factor subunit alpha [Desulfobacteraceae bacterium]